MNKFTKKIVSVLASGSLIVQLLAVGPAFASTTITISGNGATSDNTATVKVDSTTVVNQANVADVKNDVKANADSGNNNANYNTGGSVSVETGNAKTDVKVANDVNHNAADVKCCPTGDTEVLIKDNGYDSNNTVNLDLNQSNKAGTYVNQYNAAKVDNKVDANADTGSNDANYNNGGSVSISTGNAESKAKVGTSANTNMAVIGGSGGSSSTLLSAKILGNSALSDNTIDLDFDRSIVINQANVADIKNDVKANADTGNNNANYNSGGNVGIETGDATTDTNVQNDVNFNWADLNCGCLLDVEAKIAGNGYDSNNTITANLLDEQYANQVNLCGKGEIPDWYEEWDHKNGDGKCETKTDANADTGGNDVKYNNSGSGGDPSIGTGDAESTVDVGNSGNVNVIGNAPEFSWPDLPDFPNFEFNFNMGWLWFFLGGSA